MSTIVLDLSSPQKECEAFYFPCNQILNSDAWEESLQGYAPEKFGAYMQFRKKVLNAFRSYQLPLIALGKSTSKEAVCLVFEKVNTGGVPLSVFELVTASFAAEGFNLRDDWYGSKMRKVTGRAERIKVEPILDGVEPTDFLQAISLLHTLEKRRADIAAGKTGKAVSAVSAKRVAVLTLSLAEYQPSRLNTLRSRLSAAYKGLNTLVLREEANDFYQFYERRKENLLQIVEQAIGKAIEREAADHIGDEPEDEAQLMVDRAWAPR